MNRREEIKSIIDEVESDVSGVKNDVLLAMKQLNKLQTLIQALIQGEDEYDLDEADNMMYRIESLLDDIENGLTKIGDSLF